MANERLRATFIGKNGSLGYQTNRTYILDVMSIDKCPIAISRSKATGGYCEYESIISFFQNWKDVSLEEDSIEQFKVVEASTKKRRIQ